MQTYLPDASAFQHHHIDLIAHGHVALAVVQHDQAVGLHHRAEHAWALIAGGADHQAAVGRATDDAALVLGAARLFADGFAAAGFASKGFVLSPV